MDDYDLAFLLGVAAGGTVALVGGWAALLCGFLFAFIYSVVKGL